MLKTRPASPGGGAVAVAGADGADSGKHDDGGGGGCDADPATRGA